MIQCTDTEHIKFLHIEFVCTTYKPQNDLLIHLHHFGWILTVITNFGKKNKNIELH
jgi:hypothetical protein